MGSSEKAIEQTKQWVREVVIGCNLCPFAAPVVKKDRLYYVVDDSRSIESSLETFMLECNRLDADPDIETTLIIYTHAFADFDTYLGFLEVAEALLAEYAYDGIYQVASFHPHYRFAGSEAEDAANFTNRSPYPMLHLLRESSVEKALETYPDAEKIPQRNIDFARSKGLAYMKMLRDACLSGEGRG